MNNFTKIKNTQSKRYPADWMEFRLGDVLDITSSKRIFMSEYVDDGVPFYRGKEIIEKANGIFDVSDQLFINESRFLEIEAKFGSPKEDDILLSSVGTLGVPYLVKKRERFYFKDGNLTWFKNYKEDIYPKFLYYWIQSPVGKEKILSSAIGSTQPALTIDGLKKITIELPPVAEQKIIADILATLDQKVDLNRKIVGNLEKITATLFKNYFVDRKGFSNGDFRSGKLSDLVNYVSDRYVGNNEVDNYPYVPIDRISSKSLSLTSVADSSDAKSSLIKFHKDDILFGAMRPYFHKVCIAPFEGLTRTTCFILRPKKIHYFAFCTQLIFQEETVNFANAHSEGSTIPYAKWNGSLENM